MTNQKDWNKNQRPELDSGLTKAIDNMITKENAQPLNVIFPK